MARTRQLAPLAVVAVAGLAVLAAALGRATAPGSTAADQPGEASPTPGPTIGLRHAILAVDGVHIDLTTPILPGDHLVSTQAGASYQEASSIEYTPPFGTLELGAVPYGDTNPSLSTLTAAAGSAPAFRREIADSHAANLVESHAVAAMLFGQAVEGQATQTTESVDGAAVTRTHAEWVTEAGNRVWLLRFSADNLGGPDAAALRSLLPQVALAADDVGTPTTISAHLPSGPAVQENDRSFSVGTPPWWQGAQCDGGRNAAHSAMASWNGLVACGPNNDQLSLIVPAAGGVPRWGGELEWECVELSKRYIWQRYGVSDPPADGYSTVDAEAAVAPFLQRIRPDGVHVPQPGDVMSFGTTAPGHTSVVIQSSVDAQGDGGYTTLNENVGNQALIALDISHWVPTTLHGGRAVGIPPVNDWLHDPRAGSGPLGPGGQGRGVAGTPVAEVPVRHVVAAAGAGSLPVVAAEAAPVPLVAPAAPPLPAAVPDAAAVPGRAGAGSRTRSRARVRSCWCRGSRSP